MSCTSSSDDAREAGGAEALGGMEQFHSVPCLVVPSAHGHALVLLGRPRDVQELDLWLHAIARASGSYPAQASSRARHQSPQGRCGPYGVTPASRPSCQRRHLLCPCTTSHWN